MLKSPRVSLPKGPKQTASNDHPYGLTRRELAIIRALKECRTTREISARFGFNPDTARTHYKNIYRKTGADNMQSLVLFAIRKRLLTIEVEEQP